MPVAIRDSYQYFTQSAVDNLRRAGYNAGFTPLENAVNHYVTVSRPRRSLSVAMIQKWDPVFG